METLNFDAIAALVKQYPNDQDLGREVRRLMNPTYVLEDVLQYANPINSGRIYPNADYKKELDWHNKDFKIRK